LYPYGNSGRQRVKELVHAATALSMISANVDLSRATIATNTAYFAC